MRGVTFYKYQGAGNDFLIADNLDGAIELSADDISSMCDRRYGIGADGVMLLGKSDSAAFRMEYYNADGSGGMMCGNGGRCIAALLLIWDLPAGMSLILRRLTGCILPRFSLMTAAARLSG